MAANNNTPSADVAFTSYDNNRNAGDLSITCVSSTVSKVATTSSAHEAILPDATSVCEVPNSTAPANVC